MLLLFLTQFLCLFQHFLEEFHALLMILHLTMMDNMILMSFYWSLWTRKGLKINFIHFDVQKQFFCGISAFSIPCGYTIKTTASPQPAIFKRSNKAVKRHFQACKFFTFYPLIKCLKLPKISQKVTQSFDKKNKSKFNLQLHQFHTKIIIFIFAAFPFKMCFTFSF